MCAVSFFWAFENTSGLRCFNLKVINFELNHGFIGVNLILRSVVFNRILQFVHVEVFARRFLLLLFTRTTCKEFVLEFFRQLIRDAPVPSNQIVIVDDKHAHHHKKLVTEFLKQVGVTILFLPPYSSVMNP